MVLGAATLIVGAVGILLASGTGFAAATGATVLGSSDDLLWGKIVQFNALGALVTMALGALALVGAWKGSRAAVLVAAAGFGACTLQVAVQFGHSSNVLGGRGGNLGVYLALSVGLALLALTPEPAAPGSLAADPAISPATHEAPTPNG